MILVHYGEQIYCMVLDKIAELPMDLHNDSYNFDCNSMGVGNGSNDALDNYMLLAVVLAYVEMDSILHNDALSMVVAAGNYGSAILE